MVENRKPYSDGSVYLGSNWIIPMNDNEMLEPQKSPYLTSSWLVGVLILALGTILTMYFSFVQSSQAQVNSNTQTQINGIQNQLAKQTAILILIATKDGIPAQEIANLTN
jgi:hypothetical protein